MYMIWTPAMIKELRAKYKISQVALGILVGVSGNYVYMLEGGERKPSKTLCLLLDRIAEELAEKEKEKGGNMHG